MPKYLGTMKSFLTAIPQYATPTVVSLITFGLVARLLSTSELGVYGLVVSVTYLIGLTSNFGIKKIIIIKISKGDSRYIYWAGLIYSLITIIIFSTVTVWLFSNFKIFEEIEMPKISYTLFLILLIVFSLRNYLTAGLEAYKMFHLTSVYTSVGFIAYRILMILSVLYGLSVYGIIISWIIGEMISITPTLIKTVSIIGLGLEETSSFRFTDIFKEASPIYLSDLTLVLIDYGDRILTGLFGLYFLANFYIASTGAQSLSSLTQALYSGLLPHIAEEYGNNHEEFEEYLRRLSKFFSLTLSPIYMTSAILAYPLIFIFVGPTYNAAIPLFQIMVVGLWMAAIQPLIITTLLATENAKEAMISQLIGLLIDIVILIGLYDVIGFLSAGFGKAFLYVSTMTIGIFFVYRKLGVIPYDIMDILKIILANLATGILLWIFWVYTFRISLLPIYIIASLVTYTIFLRLLKIIHYEDIRILESELPLKGKIRNIIIKLISKLSGIEYDVREK